MKVDLKGLQAGLERLTGRDFIEAASEEQRAPLVPTGGDTGVTVRLASKALGVPAQELLGLPLRDFMRLTRELGEFFADTLETQSPETSTDK